MASTTDRFGLDTYSSGEEWDHTDTVQLLDEIGVEKDIKTNRPAGTYDNELFFATDERILYRYETDDSSWNVIAGFGTSSSRIPETIYINEVDLNKLNTADVQNAGSGEVPVAQGDGTFTMEAQTGGQTEYRVSGTTALQASEYYSDPVYLQPDEKIQLVRISASLTDGSTDSNVYIRQYEPDGNTVHAEWPIDSNPKIVTSFTQSSYQNTGASDERAFWRIENTSATDYTPSSAAADGVEYEITFRVEIP
jgi:hypothetical protein